MKYRTEIDGLRAVAVLAVIFHHADLGFASGGYVGVDIFFVISGYLISSLIIKELLADSFSFSNFYQRRARRILPALFFMMALTAPVAWTVMIPSQFREFSFSAGATSLFLSNVYFWDVAGYFAPASAEQPLLHTWSLAIEEHFYFIFPVVLFLSYRIGGLRLALLSTILISVLSFSLSEWGWRNKPDVNYFFSFSRFWELLVGSLCAFAALKLKVPESRYLSIFGLVLIIASIFLLDEETPFPSFYALLPVVGCFLILLFEKGNTFVGRLLSTRILVGIGLISYSAYLWHQPLLVFSRLVTNGQSGIAVTALAILTCFALAYFSWRYVELPFRRHGSYDHVPNAKVLMVSAAVSVLFVCFALAGKYTDISLYKYAEQDRSLANTTRLASMKYMRKRAEQYISARFSDSDKRKVLLIGDSYSKDLINAIFEASPNTDAEFSLHLIGQKCGNIFSSKDFTHHLSEREKIECKNTRRYDSPSLQERITKADLVVLASNWQPWQTEYIPETVENIKKITKAEVVVLGTKNFGKIDLPEIMDTKAALRPRLRNEIDEAYLKINSEMKASFKDSFIDVMDHFCGSTPKCKIISNDGELFTFDGKHLTEAGATELGAYLLQSSDIFNFEIKR